MVNYAVLGAAAAYQDVPHANTTQATRAGIDERNMVYSINFWMTKLWGKG
jgi:hypothetical protein